MITLGNQMKMFRLLRGMNQDQLGQVTGIDRSILSRMESGYVDPTETQLLAIKAALNWTPETEAAVSALLSNPAKPCAETQE